MYVEILINAKTPRLAQTHRFAHQGIFNQLKLFISHVLHDLPCLREDSKLDLADSNS